MPAQTVYLIRAPGPLWDGIEATVAGLPNASLVGVSTTAAEARERVPSLQPQLIVCSNAVEGISALPLLGELRMALPDALLVVFGDGYTAAELAELARLRVRGAITWTGLADETFPRAHDALRSGAFAVWDRMLLESAWSAILEPGREGSVPDDGSRLPIRVLLIDPSRYTRAALRALLGEDRRFVVVGAATDDGVALAKQLQPDVILVDPDGDGRFDLALLAALVAAAPECRVCVRTHFFDPKTILGAMEVGVFAYFLKGEADPIFLLDALALIGRYGAAVTGPGVVDKFRARQHARQLRVAASEPEDLGLTDREHEILERLAGGERDEGIAAHFGVTKSTIESHVANIRVKLKAETRAHLIARAYTHGLLRPYVG